jgi:hypothetical protein
MLTIFQCALDALPPISIFLLIQDTLRYLWIEIIIAALVIPIGIWNYSVLRRKVFEPILGESTTPD